LIRNSLKLHVDDQIEEDGSKDTPDELCKNLSIVKQISKLYKKKSQ